MDLRPTPDEWLLHWVLLTNAVGLHLALQDKHRAKSGSTRVPEALLLGVALAGGWFGELVAFLAVWHKVRKPAFLAQFAACALAGSIGILWAAGWRP